MSSEVNDLLNVTDDDPVSGSRGMEKDHYHSLVFWAVVALAFGLWRLSGSNKYRGNATYRVTHKRNFMTVGERRVSGADLNRKRLWTGRISLAIGLGLGIWAIVETARRRE